MEEQTAKATTNLAGSAALVVQLATATTDEKGRKLNWQTIKTAWQTARDFGLGWTIRRVFYELQLRTGHHKHKMPKRAWREKEQHFWLPEKWTAEELLDHWRQQAVRFFFSSSQFAEITTAIKQLGAKVEAVPPEG